VLLNGQAGVGKSSFVHASVLPRLQWKHQVFYLRRNPRSTSLRTLRDNLNALGGSGAELASSLSAAWMEVENNG
jgi:hypothetical protein